MSAAQFSLTLAGMIWFNGQLNSAPQMDATGAGALLGWGVFTTLAIRAGQPLLWEKHAARLARDAAAARVEAPFDGARLRAGLDELLTCSEVRDGLARITGTRRGDGRWNGQAGADWSIIAHSAPPIAREPLHLEVSPFRVAARAPLSGVKTTSYLPYLVAWEAARARDFDEALLLTERGWVCETARASIFWARDGALCTPSLRCGCLRGVGREWIIEQSGALEGQYGLKGVLEADECFIVSGATGVRAVSSIAYRGQIYRADSKPMTAEMCRLWDAL